MWSPSVPSSVHAKRAPSGASRCVSWAACTAVGACGGDSRLGLRKCLCFGDDQFGVGYAQNQSDYTITSTLHTLGEQLSVLSSTVAADTLEFLEGF